MRAALRLDDMPLLDGARQTISSGILSSLHPQNVQVAADVQDAQSASQHPLWPILFDPQTGTVLTIAGRRLDGLLIFVAVFI